MVSIYNSTIFVATDIVKRNDGMPPAASIGPPGDRVSLFALAEGFANGSGRRRMDASAGYDVSLQGWFGNQR
jgi:hypothetical protein